MRRQDPTRTIKFLTIDETSRLFKAIGDHKRNRVKRHGHGRVTVSTLATRDSLAATETSCN
jgi:hypothetical protein